MKLFDGRDPIREIFWCEIIPSNFMCWFREVLGPNRFGRIMRKILFPRFMRPSYDFWNFYMDDEKAQWIKYNTIEFAHTQRALSRDFKKEYPETDVISGDQYDGRELQRYCEDYLKIDLDELRDKSENYKKSIKEQAKLLKELFKKVKKEMKKDS